ncbi:MAG TPA: hypothetical protein VN677_08960 [Gemmatimonadaceae bacterium]|jgi:hypothetical protein|nr:hypothetical protein [Gemmatimonadaceae bacterium]
MSDNIEQPPRGYTTEDVESMKKEKLPRTHSIWKRVLAIVIIVPIVLFAVYTWAALHVAYGHGERAGYLQKLSKQGWLCQTWEGELAMANLPGTMPEIFHFTVRSDSIAQLLTQQMGKRVSLSFDEHRGVPTSCFGETEYYVTHVQASQ